MRKPTGARFGGRNLVRDRMGGTQTTLGYSSKFHVRPGKKAIFGENETGGSPKHKFIITPSSQKLTPV